MIDTGRALDEESDYFKGLRQPSYSIVTIIILTD